MANRMVSTEADERARLEQFLEWQDAGRRDRRRARRRSLLVVAGTLALGAVAMLLVATSLGRPAPGARRVTSGAPKRTAAGVVVTPFREIPSVPPRALDRHTRPSGARRRPAPEARAPVAPTRVDPQAPASDRPTLARADEKVAVTTPDVSPPTPTVPTPAADAVAASPPEPPPSDPVVVVAVEPPISAATSSTTAPPVMTDPSPTGVAPAPPGATVTAASGSKTIETLKRMVGYMPEVRLGKAVVRWARSQPPVDRGYRPPTPDSPQAR